MLQNLLSLLDNFSPELITAILATLPITELRASIPVAISLFDLETSTALFYSYLGNLLPVFLIFWLFPPLLRLAEKRVGWLNRLLEHKIGSLEKKHRKRYDQYGLLFLVLFVAVPLPGSGVWTGSLLAIIFKIDPRYSIPAILFGMFLSGLIVLSITMGLIGSLEFLLPKLGG